MKPITLAAVVLLSSVAGNRTAQAPSGPAQTPVNVSSMAGIECVQCPLIWMWIKGRITGG